MLPNLLLRLLMLLLALVFAAPLGPLQAQGDEGLVAAEALSEPTPSPPAPVDPRVLWAEARRTALPAFAARTEAALVRVELGRAYFAGEERLEVAFPEIAVGPMQRTGWLDSQLATNTVGEVARLRERALPPPAFGDDEREARYIRARDVALDAEDLAATLQRRLLLALRSLNVDHPSLAGEGYDVARRRLDARMVELDSRANQEEPGEEHDRTLSEIAATQRDLARLDALASTARRVATVPGARAALDPSDLGRLGVPKEAEGAADRLERLRPMLSADDSVQVDSALVAWLEGSVLPALRVQVEGAVADALSDVSADALAIELEAKRRAQLAAEAVLVANLPATPGTPAALRRKVLSLRVERASLTVKVLEARLATARARSEETAAREAAERAAERALEARKEAEEAARQANDAVSRRLADVLESVAAAEASTEKAWNVHRNAQEAFAEAEAQWADEVRALDADVLAVLENDTGIGSLRSTKARATWVGLHDLLTTLREAAIRGVNSLDEAETARGDNRSTTLVDRAALEDARTFVNDLTESEERSLALDALDGWELALSSRAEATDQRLEAAEAQRNRTFSTLRRVKDMRDVLRQAVPGRDRVQTSNLFHDIQLELRLFAPNLRALVRRRLADTLTFPRLLTEPDALVDLIVGSFWTLFVLFVGLGSRARLPRLVEPLVMRLNHEERQLFQRDFRPLVVPVTVVAVAALDLLVLSLLLGPVRDRFPELGILLIVLRIAVLFRLVDGLFRLAVAPTSERRPALVAVSIEAWPLVARAERLLILWLLLGTLVQYVIGDVIGAEALAWLAAQVFLFAFLGLTLFLLHLSEPHVRRSVSRNIPDGPIKRYLAEPPKSGFLTRAPRAAVGLTLVLAQRAWQLVQGNVDESSVLGRALNVVNRRRLAQQEEQVLPLPSEVSTRLRRPVTPMAARLLYETAWDEADDHLARWKTERSRGLALLVGDRGQGKHVLINEWAEAAAQKQGLEVRVGQMNGRVVGESALFTYVGRILGLDGVGDSDSFAKALRAAPPTLFVIEELENGFLRRVGGFSGLRALLRVITASCERHFWMLTVHAPAWRLLERIGTVVNPNSFRHVIELPRLGGAELQKWLIRRTRQAGYEPDFGPLSSSTAAGQPAAESDRTAEAFFRLLAEASGGNPGVAVPLWALSLSPSNPDVQDLDTLRVRLPEVISNPQLHPLSDPALLILAAVRVHGGLTVSEIVQVNNMEADLVQSTVQVLDNLGLLHRVGGRFHIDMTWLTAITRLLRRRHFVYGKDVA